MDKNQFITTAVWNKTHYNHFGIHSSLASMYGDDPEDIENLTMEIADDQSVPEPNGEYEEADYWGWYDNEKEEFSMIYPQRFLLEMCFPYGLKASEDRGQGKSYRLKINK